MINIIKLGSKGDSVRIAKYLTGYNGAGNATAKYDKAFMNYIAGWKTEHGLSSSDVIGVETWKVIALNAPQVSAREKAAVWAFRLAVGLTGSSEYSSIVKTVIKAIQKGEGLTINGICGADTWGKVLRVSRARNAHTANYKQNDKRWSEIIYSRSGKETGQTCGNSGCAPTSMASVITSLTNHTVTPDEMCALAVQSGYRRNSGGTDGAFFTYAGKKYGLRCVETTSTTVFKYCLDAGGAVICAFKPGSWWTHVGHYSPCWKYDANYFWVDNTISRIKVKRKMKYLSGDCRAFYCIFPMNQ